MHTIKAKYQDYDSQTAGYKGVTREATVHFNSDWSGDVIIQWQAGGTPRHPNMKEVKIPASVLLAIAVTTQKKNLIDQIIRYLEDL